MTFDIHVHTQDSENYNFDLTPGQDYWKFKSGVTYVIVAGLAPTALIGRWAEALVQKHRGKIEIDNASFRSYIRDWELVPSGQLTEDEVLQQEYDGKVTWPSRRLA